MAGVEEIRAGIAQSGEKFRNAIAALQQGAQVLEEGQQLLVPVTAGSSQPEVTQAHGLLAEALQGITGLQSTIEAAISSAERYSARL